MKSLGAILSLGLFFSSVSADPITPYWGERDWRTGCNESGCLPGLDIWFLNPETEVSGTGTFGLISWVAEIAFDPIMTADYRDTTDCLTCDVFFGTTWINMWNDFPGLFSPHGYFQAYDWGGVHVVFDGTSISLLEDAAIPGLPLVYGDDWPWPALIIRTNGTWAYTESLDNGSGSFVPFRSQGTWQRVPEPFSWILVLLGVGSVPMLARRKLT